MAIVQLNSVNDIPANAKQILWCREDGTTNSSLMDPGFTAKNVQYDVNGGGITVNGGVGGNGPVCLYERVSKNRIDVNFPAREQCLLGRYPAGSNMPGFTPIVIEFSNPVKGVAAFVMVVRPSVQAIPNGSPLSAIIMLDISDMPFVSDVGFVGGSGSQKVPPFIGVQSDSSNEKIGKVWFDATRKGNWDELVISQLYWWA
jgi:hypothetical protein